MNIDETQIQAMIKAALDERENFNVYNVSPIPSHGHTGTDSQQIDPNNLINASLYFAVAKITLTKTQILTLHGAPVTLVPAMGSTATAGNLNTVVIVEGITAKIYAGSIAYTGANNLEFRYTNASGAKVTADIANTFINTTVSTQAYTHVAGIITQFTPVFNSPIVVTVPTANPAAGNGSIIISVKYRAITL